MKKNNCTIIISSCDAYSDAWAPFFTLFFRYWPDCPFRIILISNGLEYNDPRVETYKIIKDLGWSGNLIETAKNITDDYIIFFQEDYFLKNKVNNEEIFTALNLMAETKAAYLRLYPCPGPDLPFNNNADVGTISLDSKYRNSTQTAIWDRLYFISLLKIGETGWDFETGGGIERSRQTNRPYLSFKKPIIDYFCTAIVKGRYVYDAINFCRKEGVTLDLKKRKSENLFGFIVRKSGIKQKLYPIKKWLTKK
jgi:hypothetical protein